jgi:hypothetical protein
MINFEDEDEPKKGTWTVSSIKDPRWNGSGEATTIGSEMPNELELWIKHCMETIGEPPSDLDENFWPDAC